MTVLLHSSVDTAETDERLVSRALAGEAAAVRTIVQRYNQPLFRVARSVVGNDAEAEDVVQATYVSAFTHLKDFRFQSRLLTWLTRIALNDALGRLRRRRPTAPLEALETAEPSAEVIAFHTSTPNPEAEMQREEIRQALERVIDELPQPFRTVFVLREVEGLSVEETAVRLDLKPETVRTRLFRARRMLRTALETQLSGTFAALYPFDGARCVSMADRVLQDLARLMPDAWR
jgi:RNA polymerase sigma-70 factor (ECF subfamily)